VNINLTLPTVLTVIGLTLTVLGMLGGVGFVVLRIGKWIQLVNDMLMELRKFAEDNSREILSLRASRHEHGEAILILRQGLEGVQEDVGDLLHRRKSDRAEE